MRNNFFVKLFLKNTKYSRPEKHDRLIIGDMQPYSSKTGKMKLPIMDPSLPTIISRLTAIALTNK